MKKPAVRKEFQLEETSIQAIHQALRRGTLTARALVAGYLKRIDAHDQQGAMLNAVVSLNTKALAQAAALDRAYKATGKLQGPLHGIPVLVKDNIDTTEAPTSYGNVAFATHVPAQDATVIARLRAAGAILLGKTTLPDFATSWWAYSSRSGETRNPYDLARDPGGSSAGTGSAIAANFATVGLGTDCGGSIRVPASHCGLVGIRSTPGVVSRAGSSPLVSWQDTVGPMARSVADAVAVFEAIAGYDPRDSLSVNHFIARAPRRYADSLDKGGLKRARLGLITNALGSDAAATPVTSVVRDAVAALQAAGATVVEVEIPDLARQLVDTSLYVNCSKSDLNAFLMGQRSAPVRRLQALYDARQYHPRLDLLEACMAGPEAPEHDPQYYRRLAAREAFQRQLMALMAAANLEAFIFPDVQVEPPTRRDLDSGKWTTLTYPTNTLIASQAWLPAMTVPAGFTARGLPVGLEFMGRPGDEPTLFRLGYAFEQATRQRRAPVL